MEVIQQDLALLSDVGKHLYYLETTMRNRTGQLEKSVLMINSVLVDNRIKSIGFTSEVKFILRDKKDQMTDLKATQNELIMKKDSIIEEQETMK